MPLLQALQRKAVAIDVSGPPSRTRWLRLPRNDIRINVKPLGTPGTPNAKTLKHCPTSQLRIKRTRKPLRSGNPNRRAENPDKASCPCESFSRKSGVDLLTSIALLRRVSQSRRTGLSLIWLLAKKVILPKAGQALERPPKRRRSILIHPTKRWN